MSLTIITEACMGCRICELVCNFYNEKKFGTQNSIIKIGFNDDSTLHIDFSKFCNCCRKDEYPCVDFCPTNAIIVSSSKENKIIMNYNENLKK